VMKNRPWAQTQSDEPLLAKLGRRAYSAVIIIWGGGMYGTGDPHFYVLDDCFAFEQK